MDFSSIFGRKYGSFRRFFAMLGKARLPYLWIGGYLLCGFLIANVGVEATEYGAELFAGNVGFLAVVLPYLFFQILSLLLGSATTLVGQLCAARIDRNLRRMVWQKTVHLRLGFFEKNNPKELVSRITTDITAVSGLIMDVFLSAVTGLYSSLLMLRRVSGYDRGLMWSLVVVLPVNLLITFILGRMRFGVSDLINRCNAQLTGGIAERANNMMLIKSMGTEEKEGKAGEKLMKASYRADAANSWVTGLSLPVYAMASALQTVAIILVGRGYYASGALSLPQWIAYYGFAIQLTNLLSTYCDYWSSFKGGQGAVDRVSEIMEEPEEELHQGEETGTVAGGVVFEDVSFSYGDAPLFRNLNLTIPAGRITAIVGPSGGGKSTLLNLVERLYAVDEGTIRIGGKDVRDFSLSSYRRALGYVTQESVLYAGTIRENLQQGLNRRAGEEELDEACQAAGILDYVRSLPEGYETKVGENGASLSGGQRQRFSVARALLKEPDCLLLDEATAAMDIGGKDHVWESIRRVMAGKTVVYVAHDAQTLQHADYIIVLDRGKVEAAGEREDILASSAYCREMTEDERGEDEK